MMDENFWYGKRVLVTGHTGFKGSWLTFWLNELGAKVAGISLTPTTNPNVFDALNLKEKCHHSILDIRDRVPLQKQIEEINPEIVFHMAAQPFVRFSYENPLETYETNVIGTGNVLAALRTSSHLRAVVVITTDKCYENREWAWGYRETDALGGFDPYSSSKACAEILTASFRRSFFSQKDSRVGIATARAGNVIGGGDWSADRLIPDLVRAATLSRDLEIRYPDSIRPWQHVLVPLSGYLVLAEKLWENPQKFSNAYNFAPVDDDCIPVRQLINDFGVHWGESIRWYASEGEKPHEATFLKLDSSKAKAELKWRPLWTLNDALRASALWYRKVASEPAAIEEFTRSQINRFTERGRVIGAGV